jgi:hypothetical protein
MNAGNIVGSTLVAVCQDGPLRRAAKADPEQRDDLVGQADRSLSRAATALSQYPAGVWMATSGSARNRLAPGGVVTGVRASSGR